MAINEKLTNKIWEALVDVPNITEKTMFHWIAFMVDDKMCITLGNNEIMRGIDALIQKEYFTKEGCRTMVMKGSEYKGYPCGRTVLKD